MILSEFKPALFFLGKFLLIYFVGNIVYGLFIESYGESPDPVTYAVTTQSGASLEAFGLEAEVERNPKRPTVFIKARHEVVVSVFEGCNGVNVMVVFVAFLIAFGGPLKKMMWFLPLGLLVIHVFNLARIGLLYYTSRFQPEAFYYVHKYVFTAVLYVVVFVLWAFWIRKFNAKSTDAAAG